MDVYVVIKGHDRIVHGVYKEYFDAKNEERSLKEGGGQRIKVEAHDLYETGW